MRFDFLFFFRNDRNQDSLVSCGLNTNILCNPLSIVEYSIDRVVEMTKRLSLNKKRFNYKCPRHLELPNVLDKLDILDPLSNIIVDYDNKGHPELYDKVMKRLILPKYVKDYPDFHDSNFFLQICKLEPLKKFMDSKFNDDFEYDVARLFFKWLILMRQSLDDLTFKKKIFNPLISWSSKRFKKNFSDCFIEIINFNMLNIVENPTFLRTLLNCEIIERSNDIISRFEKAKFEFYSEAINCIGLRDRYFDDNFNNDPLLRMIIQFYDNGEKMKACVSIDEHLLPTTESLKDDKITFFDFQRASFGQKINVFEISVGYVNRTIIEYFLLNQKRFMLDNHNAFAIFLKRVEEAEMLNGRILEQVIGFLENRFEWSLELFEDYLKICKEMKIISQNDYQKYSNLFMIKTK